MFLGFFDEGEAATFIAPLTDGDNSPISPDAPPTLSLLGADGPIPGTSEGEPAQAGDVEAISAGTPANVTSTAHSLQTGQAVELFGTTTRDGVYLVTVVDADHFTLDGTSADAAQASPVGDWRTAGVWKFDLPTAALSSLAAGRTYTVVISYTVADVAKVQMFNFYVQ